MFYLNLLFLRTHINFRISAIIWQEPFFCAAKDLEDLRNAGLCAHPIHSHVKCRVVLERFSFILDPESLRKSRLKQLRRQLSTVRRKLEEGQLDFENSLGYRPSQVSSLRENTIGI
jgi:hypothetical protein